MKYFILLGLFLFSTHLKAQQQKMTAYDDLWNKVQPLLDKQLSKDAEKQILTIENKARNEQNYPELIKAICLKLVNQNSRTENFETQVIADLNKEAKQMPEPYRQIVYSLIADRYVVLFNRFRWQIYDRTDVNEGGKDPSTWSSLQFFDTIARYYERSLQQAELSKSIQTNTLQPILNENVWRNEKVKFDPQLRHTLYDLLIERAIEFYKDDKIEIADAAYKFEIEDELAFAPVEEFVVQSIKTKDNYSAKFKALQLFKTYLAYCLKSNALNDLLTVDIDRLGFVYEKSTHPDKDNLYKKALKQLADKQPHNIYAAKALLLYAQQVAATGQKQGAAELFQSIISEFAQSSLAQDAKQALKAITKQEIGFECESVYQPDQPYLIKVNTRNVQKVFVHVFKTAQASNTENDERDLKKLLQQKPFQLYEMMVKDKGNYEGSEIELVMRALPMGHYHLVLSASEQLSEKNNAEAQQIATIHFSNLAFVAYQQGGTKVYNMVNRHSGEQLTDVKALFYTNVYNSAKQRYMRELSSQTMADVNGNIYNKQEQHMDILFVSGKDSLWSTHSNYNPQYSRAIDENEAKVYLFSDRSIYRPGQTIYFKGIATTRTRDENIILSNRQFVVELHDVNDQLIKMETFTTNAYGSFASSFQLPASGLSGQYKLVAENNLLYFNVEEYKRPKFEVVFDTVKANYKLGDQVRIRAKAIAYNGSAVTNAKVNYNVKREINFPCRWCWGSPRYVEPMELLHGETQTDEQGYFDLSFFAQTDKSTDKSLLPLYNFIVHADVTDINGETRSGDQSLHLANYEYTLEIDVPELVDLNNKVAELLVYLKNLQNIYTPANVNIRIEKLQTPKRPYRARLWTIPEAKSIDIASFEQQLPHDAYTDQHNKDNWVVSEVVFEGQVTTGTDVFKKAIQQYLNEKAWYKITASIASNGDMINDKKFIQVYDSKNDELLSNERISITHDKNSYKYNETIRLTIVTRCKGAAATFCISAPTYSYREPYVEYRNVILKEGKQYVDLVMDEKFKHGVNIKMSFVYQNRVVEQQLGTIYLEQEQNDLQLKLTTFRNKIEPGTPQKWTYSINDESGKSRQAELLCAMYDAALDQFTTHDWPALEKENWYFAEHDFQYENTTALSSSPMFYDYFNEQGQIQPLQLRSLYYWGLSGMENYRLGRMYKSSLTRGGSVREQLAEVSEAEDGMVLYAASNASLAGNATKSIKFTPPVIKKDEELEESKPKTTSLSIRKNLQETAFFFPQLQTDEKGNATFSFTAPEALTKWRLMAFAHDLQLMQAYEEQFITTQKELMVVPNNPRFFRQSDQIDYSVKVSNLSQTPIQAQVKLEITDAMTGQDLSALYIKGADALNVTVDRNKEVTWRLNIPSDALHPVVVRVTASSQAHSDGEQSEINILPNRMLLSETLPFYVKPNQSKQYRLNNLLESKASKSLQHYQLTLDCTPNPAWYAVQALPYLTQYPYDCAEQTFNKYFANALASHIAQSNPQIAQVYTDWLKDSNALQSALQKNQNLKQISLEETPWLNEAQNESEAKRQIAVLFNEDRMQIELSAAIALLKQKQQADGGFAWFAGMPANTYMSNYIACGFGKLKHLGVSLQDADLADMLDRLIDFCDREMLKQYKQELAQKNKKQIGCSNDNLQSLYMRSFFKDKQMKPELAKAYNYYLNKASSAWQQNNVNGKATLAIVLLRNNKTQLANTIIESLLQNSIYNEELGRYWKQFNESYYWFNAPIETQALVIECLNEANYASETIDELKLWLLKNKQSNRWSSTKSTADVCYAMLMRGTDFLGQQSSVEVQLGEQSISSTSQTREAGTGHFSIHYGPASIRPEMGNLLVKNTASQISGTWGALHWQYFEQLDQVKSSEQNTAPLALQKELYKVERNDRGEVLQAIKDENTLQVGDKVRVRIVLQVDRSMEFLHLKDMRASCFEPLNVLSGYKYKAGLGYYESTKDASSNFFFDNVAKGTFVFEYDLFVNNSGVFNNGVASIQCMYAPEFAAHSQGLKISVK